VAQVEAGTLNKLAARAIEDDGLRGVLDDLNDVAEVSVKGGRSRSPHPHANHPMPHRTPPPTASYHPRAAPRRSIVTLIANVPESSSVMAVVFQVMAALEVQVEMISQGASKVNISFVVPGEREIEVIQALHACFFEDQCIVPTGQLK
jgi:hypothetical protein